MTTETDVRERLAPRITRMILVRQGSTGMSPVEAEQLAHEILAIAGAEFLRAHQGTAPRIEKDLP